MKCNNVFGEASGARKTWQVHVLFAMSSLAVLIKLRDNFPFVEVSCEQFEWRCIFFSHWSAPIKRCEHGSTSYLLVDTDNIANITKYFYITNVFTGCIFERPSVGLMGCQVEGREIQINLGNVCSDIIGALQKDLWSLWEKQVVWKQREPHHTLSRDFTVMPSGAVMMWPSGEQSLASPLQSGC